MTKKSSGREIHVRVGSVLMELKLLKVILSKMNLASVYVVVGAISFVNSQFSVPFTIWHWNQTHTDEGSDVRNKNTMSGTQNKFTNGGLSEIKNDIFQGLSQFKNIYDGCVRKINKTFKKPKKSKVKSRLSEFKEYVIVLYKCVKVYSFRFLDQTLEHDFIPLTDYISLAKDGVNGTANETSARGLLPFGEYASGILAKEWTTLTYDRIEGLLRNYSIKIHLGKDLTVEGRSRRRDHRMFAMLVMGFIIMASILIPMGFQFLTVLGGKSLLLAKMALIMSAINGLKKIATSNVGYGFYHTGSDGHHHDHIHHGFHEKHYHVNPQHYNQQQYNR